MSIDFTIQIALGKHHGDRLNCLWKIGTIGTALLMVGSIAHGQSVARPDFEGTWKIAQPSNSLKPSMPVLLTAGGRKNLEQNKRLRSRHKYDDYDITVSRCSSPGVPRLMLTPMRFKIWQRLGVVTFDFEWNRALRQIDLRGRAVVPLLAPQMTGQTSGRWDGDTLVAETVDVSDRTLIDEIMPHSSDMKVTERFRLIDADTLEDRITIDDPVYYAKPWGGVITYTRQPDTPFFPEHVCLERRDAAAPSPRGQ